MSAALSYDLRDRIVVTIDGRLNTRFPVALFGVSVSGAIRPH